VTGPDMLIADALNELAGQAAAPPPMASTAWRAGRRRRRTAAGASAAGAAAVTAAAVLVPLAVAAGPASSRHGGTAVPLTLATPISFRQVARASNAPCPAGSAGLPADPPGRCVYLTGPTVTIARVESLRLAFDPEGGCKSEVAVTLTPAEGRLVLALTRTLQPPPAREMAIIVDGRVVAHPAVQSAFAARFVIQFSRARAPSCAAVDARAERLLRELRNR